MDPEKFVKHDKEFWIRKWKEFQGDRDFSSMRNLHNRGRWSQERKEKLDSMIAEGKSPKEIWTSHMEEMSKNEHFCMMGPLSEPEMKQKWEEMKKDGKTKEFWENYWDEAKNKPDHFGPIGRFVNPQEMQKRWEEMTAEGKTPEEFWEKEKVQMFEKMQGAEWGRHRKHGYRERFWSRRDSENKDIEGENSERFYNHFHRRGHRCFWRRQKEKTIEDDPLFKEFDF